MRTMAKNIRKEKERLERIERELGGETTVTICGAQKKWYWEKPKAQ